MSHKYVSVVTYLFSYFSCKTRTRNMSCRLREFRAFYFSDLDDLRIRTWPVSWRWPRRPKRNLNFARQESYHITFVQTYTDADRKRYTDSTENVTNREVSIDCNDILFLVTLFFVVVCRVRKIVELEEELRAVGNNMKSLEIAEQQVSRYNV